MNNAVFLGSTTKDTLKKNHIIRIDKEVKYIYNKNIPLEKKMLLKEPLIRNIMKLSVYVKDDNAFYLEFDAEKNDWFYVLKGDK